MKRFEDLKIVACFSAHHDGDWIEKTINDYSRYANEIYINLHSASKKTTEIVKSSQKVTRYIKTSHPEGYRFKNTIQGEVRDWAVRMLDSVKPDIVLSPDADETYPKNLMEQLEKFWEDEKKKTFWFRLIYLWRDDKHFRNDGIWKTIHHVRAFKWQPNLTFIPYGGYACPTNYLLSKETNYHSNMPVLHWGYLKPENRRDKFLTERKKDYFSDKKYRKEVDKDIFLKELPNELVYR